MVKLRCLFCRKEVEMPEVKNVRYTDYAVVHIDCEKLKEKKVLDKSQTHRIP